METRGKMKVTGWRIILDIEGRGLWYRSQGVVLRICTSDEHGAFDLDQSVVLRICTSSWLLQAPLGSVSAAKDLHKGLVEMEVPDMTPPTFKSVSRPPSGTYGDCLPGVVPGGLDQAMGKLLASLRGLVPCCRVAPSKLVAIGALLAVVLAEERPAIEMPTSALIGECAGRWFASSRLMPGPGG
ncbi:hypothetical protein BHM03_00033240 [Ensete ventricosum]|nr:hypothetical protein BHM03_00033240 [Ensete ventricosum]